MNPITPAELAAYFDHTQLRAYAQRGDFEKLCAEAREYGFAMVAINPAPVSLCKDLLAGTSVHVGAAVGFPLGQSTPKVKKYETVDAIANGADEIDYVTLSTITIGDGRAAEQIPSDAQGRFITADGEVFQAYYFDNTMI